MIPFGNTLADTMLPLAKHTLTTGQVIKCICELNSGYKSIRFTMQYMAWVWVVSFLYSDDYNHFTSFFH